jgi:hypothetical protein
MLSPTIVVEGIVLPGVLKQGCFKLGRYSRPETNRQVPSWAPCARSPSDRIVAVVEGALAVQQDTHMVVGVVTPPHAHSCSSVEAQMLDDGDPTPSPPTNHTRPLTVVDATL